MKNKLEQQLNWLEKEKLKDSLEVNKEKEKLINEILKNKKEDIITKPKKLTIWQRIKKVLMG